MQLLFNVPPEADGVLLRGFLRRCAVSTELARAVKFHGSGFFADDAPILANRRVQAGQTIRFALPADGPGVEPQPEIPVRVVYEDAFAVVLEKPPHLAVHPTLNYPRDTLANGYAAWAAAHGESPVFRPVNRIDKDTSGLVLAAKNGYAAPLLAEAAAGEERYRDNLGWHSVDEAAGPERVDFLLEQAARVRADADAFVVIGIGGSNQASRAAVKALRPEGGPAILWAGNTISACEMVRSLRELDGYQSICIDCIAKNFETLEPGIAFRVLRQYLERRYGAEGAAKRIFATGTPGSTLHQLCLDQGYTFLTFPETIGGRYSVGSDVGLFPMAVAGVDIRALVQGMRDMRDTLLAAPAEENPALRYACLRRLLLEHGYRLEMLSFFEPRLDYFAKWWIQLFAESEGKEGTALYPVAASNSEDLHSIGQFIQEGSPILFETFVEVRARDASVLLLPEAKKDYFDYLTGKDFWDINNTARQATMRAHSDRGIPCMNLSIPAIDAHTLGGLFYFFLFACYLSCKLLGVNPFNQPGVEGYKGYMFQNLGKPGVN